jgi:hypothetical protein
MFGFSNSASPDGVYFFDEAGGIAHTGILLKKVETLIFIILEYNGRVSKNNLLFILFIFFALVTVKRGSPRAL